MLPRYCVSNSRFSLLSGRSAASRQLPQDPRSGLGQNVPRGTSILNRSMCCCYYFSTELQRVHQSALGHLPSRSVCLLIGALSRAARGKTSPLFLDHDWYGKKEAGRLTSPRSPCPDCDFAASFSSVADLGHHLGRRPGRHRDEDRVSLEMVRRLLLAAAAAAGEPSAITSPCRHRPRRSP